MKIVFRVDSSEKIGIGHVSRCLVLANKLKCKGAHIEFICKDLVGHVCDVIKEQGFIVHMIDEPSPQLPTTNVSLGRHRHCWQNDVDASTAVLESNSLSDWLVVDHYELDLKWELALRRVTKKIMVIDDLANREHDCDLLLDQNFYQNRLVRYTGLVPDRCTKLLGPQYALLRPEYEYVGNSISIRDGIVKNILVCFGGSDPVNQTAKVIEAVCQLRLNNVNVHVVVGRSNPWRERIRSMCDEVGNFQFYYDVTDMANLMREADFFIGAGGSTTWERCAAGLPALIVAIADNQREISKAVAAFGAAEYLGTYQEVSVEDLRDAIRRIIRSPETLKVMSKSAMQLSDGIGVTRVVEKMEVKN